MRAGSRGARSGPAIEGVRAAVGEDGDEEVGLAVGEGRSGHLGDQPFSLCGHWDSPIVRVETRNNEEQYKSRHMDMVRLHFLLPKFPS
ncbi:hypothetical protein ABZP36_003641 [Zizania latifolia]